MSRLTSPYSSDKALPPCTRPESTWSHDPGGQLPSYSTQTNSGLNRHLAAAHPAETTVRFTRLLHLESRGLQRQ